MLAAMVAAAQEAGVPFNDDHNGETLDGVGYSQLTIRDGIARDRGQRLHRPGRQIRGCASTRAPGARGCASPARAARASRSPAGSIEADREVVLCAGTLESPEAAHARRHRAGRRARAPRDRAARRRARRRAQPARPPDRPGHLRLAARDPGGAAGALTAPRAPVLAQPRGPAGARHPAAVLSLPDVRRHLDGGAARGLHDPRRAHPHAEPRDACACAPPTRRRRRSWIRGR